MLGGDIWRAYKSIDTSPTAYAEAALSSVTWDGGEAISPLARPQPVLMGFMTRAAVVASLVGALFGFQAGCTIVSHNMKASGMKLRGAQCTEAAARNVARRMCGSLPIKSFDFDKDSCEMTVKCGRTIVIQH